jgi:hypothetical protein
VIKVFRVFGLHTLNEHTEHDEQVEHIDRLNILYTSKRLNALNRFNTSNTLNTNTNKAPLVDIYYWIKLGCMCMLVVLVLSSQTLKHWYKDMLPQQHFVNMMSW